MDTYNQYNIPTEWVGLAQYSLNSKNQFQI